MMQQNRNYSMTPDAIRKRKERLRNQEANAEKKRRAALAEGNKKRRRAAGWKAKQTRNANLRREQELRLAAVRSAQRDKALGLAKDVTEAHKIHCVTQGDLTRSQGDLTRVQGDAMRGVFTTLNGLSPNSAPSSAFSAAPSAADSSAFSAASSVYTNDDDTILSSIDLSSAALLPSDSTEDSSFISGFDSTASSVSVPPLLLRTPVAANPSFHTNQRRAQLQSAGDDTVFSSLKRKHDDEVATVTIVPRKKKCMSPQQSTNLLAHFCLPFLSDVARVGLKAADCNLSEVVFAKPHAEFRLKMRGGILSRDSALQLMQNGTIIRNTNPQYDCDLMVSFLDERHVEHQWPLLFPEFGLVLVPTYKTKSPLCTLPRHRRRRNMMLRGLIWLSDMLEVEDLGLLGWYLAHHTQNLANRKLYVPGLPTIMDVVESILPTQAEINLLRSIEFASEMGDVESWILSIREIPNAPQKVAVMRRFAWGAHEVEFGPKFSAWFPQWYG